MATEDQLVNFQKPLHPYTQALMEAIPIPNPERKKKRAELRGEVPSAIDIPVGCRFRTRCSYEEKTCREEEPELVLFRLITLWYVDVLQNKAVTLIS